MNNSIYIVLDQDTCTADWCFAPTVCLKPCVVYSKLKLEIEEENAFKRTLDGVLYTCGSSLQGLEVERKPSDAPFVQTLIQHVFLRENLSCDEPVEIQSCIHRACAVTETREGAYPM